ncbi:hypothetical protein EN822_23090 [bacterium M00.F.Ca.ET.179.01.1.1]|nr:hypothetical protein EN822_23090 [bacterium M00.F.Ca.ET.179.01.1.1]
MMVIGLATADFARRLAVNNTDGGDTKTWSAFVPGTPASGPRAVRKLSFLMLPFLISSSVAKGVRGRDVSSAVAPPVSRALVRKRHLGQIVHESVTPWRLDLTYCAAEAMQAIVKT